MTVVAYQGEPGAFSEQAALEIFGGAEARGHPAFRDVFSAVLERRADYGVLPIENSIMGSIHQNYDLLLEFDVSIVREHKLRISHCLIAHPGVREEELAMLYVHPAAAAQCERFVRAHPAWTIYQTYDTAGSVRMIRDTGPRHAGAVASARAARLYGMEVVREAIEDNPQNYTRFIVVGRTPERLEGRPKTSVVFATKNEPGALYGALKPFAERRVNLAKIESRPIPGRPWEYLFYLDFEGTPEGAALEDLRGRTQWLRVLGCYPAA